jgi:hypothetical protein
MDLAGAKLHLKTAFTLQVALDRELTVHLKSRGGRTREEGRLENGLF